MEGKAHVEGDKSLILILKGTLVNADIKLSSNIKFSECPGVEPPE